jgi:steroid delta-isomerase-like uncharacterized protein
MTKWSYVAEAFVAVSVLACAVEKKPPVAEGGEAVVDAYVRAWNERDSAAIDSLLAPNGVHEDLAQNFRGQGSAQVVGFMRKTITTQPDFKWQITTSIEDGRYVALEWTWGATYTGPDLAGKQVNNRRISARGSSLAEVEKGRIKRITDYWDLASAFR